MPASAPPGLSPARSRCSTSAQASAESVRASRPSSSTGGSVAARAAVAPGHPFSRPLWLNSQRSAANGAAAASPGAVPSVAERTAASSARVRVTRARSANEASAQIGPARR